MNKGQSHKSGNFFKGESQIEVSVHDNVNLSDFIYYECQISNEEGASLSLPATYDEQRQQPLVNKASDYKFAVIRLETNLSNIPMFLVGNEANYPLSFELVYNGAVGPIIITKTLFNTQVLRKSIYTNQIVLNEYNDKLKEGWDDLIIAYNAILGPLAWQTDVNKPQSYPGVEYDTSTKLYSLLIDAKAQTTNVNNGVFWGANDNLFRLLAGMNADRIADSGFRFVYVFPFGFANSNVETPVAPPSGYAGPYLRMTQVWSSDPLWYSVSQVVITSDALGCRKTYIGNPNQKGINILRNVIADFTITMDNTDSSSPATRYRYIPPGEYRWTDMFSDEPLNRIEFKVYYLFKSGQLYPVLVQSNDSLTMKFLFARKIF